MVWGFLVMAVVGLAFAQVFGPSMRRTAIAKRLESGSRTISDRTSVTVTGTLRVRDDQQLEAPLSGRRGLIVYAHAELPEIDGRVGATENTTLVTKKMVPFALETINGTILVDGTDVDIVFPPAKVPKRSVERERAFVVEHGRGAEVAAVATFRELVLVPGLRVAVHGMAIVEASDANTERGYRDAVPTHTRLVALPEYPITIGRPRD